MQSFNTVVQKVQAHMKKQNNTYPGDVKLLEMLSVIWNKSCIVGVVYRWNGDIVEWWYGEMVLWQNCEIFKCRKGDMAAWWNGEIMI